MKKRKLIYQSPKWHDLNQFNAIGQVSPEGICTAGGNPIYRTCAEGSLPEQPAEYCNPNGLAPQFGRCTLGGIAAEGCKGGSAVTQCVSGSSFAYTCISGTSYT